MRNRFVCSEAGFTLLEVLVAASILSVCIVLSMELFGGCMKSITKADNHTKAVFLAKQVLDEDIDPLDVEVGETDGTFEEPFSEFSWKKAISSYQKEGESKEKSGHVALEEGVSVKIAKVTVTVSYKALDSEGKKDLVTLETLKTYFSDEKDNT